ncbi:MAG: sugar transferase [Terriglobia bacterium]
MSLRRRASASDSGERTGWWASTAGHDWFLCAQDFARALMLERKRVERSRKLLLLMLVGAGKSLGGEDGKEVLAEILAVLSSATRETDIRGWHEQGSVIGIIFTEIAEGEKSLVGDAVLQRMQDQLQAALGAARARGITISVNFFPEDWNAGHPADNGNRELKLFRNGDDRKAARILKRMIDVAGSIVALAALSPLFALIAGLVKLTSDGPVFFRQKRVGQHGRPFRCFKFRSMRVTNDASIHQEYVRSLILGGEAKPGAVYKLRNDPRITPLGRLLRKASLDELPQFWNVLKGDMSLVGPRPAIPYELECYDVWHRRRVLGVKPGITGLWQVQGRSRTTFDEMVRLDLRYAKSWSVWLDLKILLKTPGAVVSGVGAY